MKLKDGLEILVKDFNKEPYKNFDIGRMKEHISEVLNKCGESAPERAFKESFKNKLLKLNTKENILLAISDKMFALSGEGV